MRKNNSARSTFPLFMLSEGETARVAFIHGGHQVRKRLAELGIIPGKSIEVSHGTGHGPRVVKFDETQIMIGHGMLHMIYVEL